VSAGDVVLFGPRGRKTPNRLVDHVGLALGGGWFIHAGGQGVTLDRLDAPWWTSAFVFARRPA
jgi:cell wall-associated NlpC family hydrolase